MDRITLTLTVDFDTAPSVLQSADELREAIQSRVFGAGVFGPDTLVDCWDISMRVELDYNPKS